MSETSPRILLVDDEPALLDALRRTHRKRYDLATATGGAEGLVTLREEGPFDVVVSDYMMPEMNGAVFLSKVAESAPDCVRLMLTGNADVQAAIDAVNRGNVFRFLTKPCDPELFTRCIAAAMEQVRLRRAEKELLEGTLKGSIEVLSEVLSLCNPEAFGRASRIRNYVVQLVRILGAGGAWQVESAALLSQVGCVALPSDLLTRVATGEKLTAEQARAYDRYPEIGAKLLGHIPRLEDVAEIVRRQRFRYEDLRGEGDLSQEARRGGQILAACLEFDELIGLGASKADAIKSMAGQQGAHSMTILKALASVQPIGSGTVARFVKVAEIREGMIMGQDVRGKNGTLIVANGHRISASLVERLTNYHRLRGVEEPIRVLDKEGGEGSAGADSEAA